MSTTGDLDDSTIEALQARVRGEVLEPGETGYDEARIVWNRMIDRYPAIIVRCRGAADVIAAVNTARENDIPLAVKSGGHNVSGSAVCDDGLVIDLSPMDAVEVDPTQNIARVQAGATWGDIDHETQAFGLATPGGQDPNIGVAGLTLGGGYGYLSRKYGYTCDNLLSANVVTAEGELVRPSPSQHSDLFWGLRGGGGNFGIVTSFEFQLHEVGPEVFAGSLIYSLEDAHEVTRQYQSFMADAPREASSMLGIMELPATSYYPEPLHNARVLMLITMYVGSPEDGRRVLAPLRAFGNPRFDSLQERTYTSYQQAGESQADARTYVRSQFLETLSEPAVDTIVEFGKDVPSSGATVFASPRNGAMTDLPTDETAYPHRDDSHHVLIEARWSDPDRDDAHIEWIRSFHAALQPYTINNARMNFLTDDEPRERIKAAYGSNYRRLVDLKRQWDPENLFSMNQNIDPQE